MLTGMHFMYIGVCSEGILYPHAHLSEFIQKHTDVGVTLSRSSFRVSEDLTKRAGKSDYPRFFM